MRDQTESPVGLALADSSPSASGFFPTESLGKPLLAWCWYLSPFSLSAAIAPTTAP